METIKSEKSAEAFLWLELEENVNDQSKPYKFKI